MSIPFAQKFLLALVIIAGAGMVRASKAEAQGIVDCGKDCVSCGFFFREGANHASPPEGVWDMQCRGFTTSCSACGEASVARPAGEVDAILAAVRLSGTTELTAVARRYGERLLINAARNMVVIQGSNCDPTALITAFFVPAERMAALMKAGIRPLQSFLADREREGTGKRA